MNKKITNHFLYLFNKEQTLLKTNLKHINGDNSLMFDYKDKINTIRINV